MATSYKILTIQGNLFAKLIGRGFGQNRGDV
jgi:hypothetical protein